MPPKGYQHLRSRGDARVCLPPTAPTYVNNVYVWVKNIYMCVKNTYVFFENISACLCEECHPSTALASYKRRKG